MEHMKRNVRLVSCSLVTPSQKPTLLPLKNSSASTALVAASPAISIVNAKQMGLPGVLRVWKYP
jgi:hypothetical protein